MFRGGAMAAAAHNNIHMDGLHADTMMYIEEGDEDDRKENLLDFFTELPDASTFERDQIVHKKSVDETFIPRRMVITERTLFFSTPGTDRVLDDVLLHEVEKIGRIPPSSSTVRRQSSVLGEVHDNDGGTEFVICTTDEGRNSGRAYHLKCSSVTECAELTNFLQEQVNLALARERSMEGCVRAKAAVKFFYEHDITQVLIAVLIFLSFLGNVTELEIDPGFQNVQSVEFFYALDLFFTVIFAVELAVNMFAHWFRDFWRDYWNIFDFFIVCSSLIALIIDRVGSQDDNNSAALYAVRAIRLLRAFRVMRLFGRLESIRKIISALGKSLIPVGNAFIIVLLIMSVYAIVGVNLFREANSAAFGTWSRGLYTMFTVTTVDGWQELVVMPMICPNDVCPEGITSPTVPEDLLVVFFFVSFVVIVVWTMLPVVVAILLENFTNATRIEELASERKKMARSGLDKMQHTLDPIFEVLSHYNTDLDLSQKIDNLFQVMVADDEKDRVDFKAMSSGLKRKKWLQRIHLSQEDFDSFTCHGYYSTDGWLSQRDFEQAMRTQLKRYVQRQVAKQQFLCHTSPGQESSSSMLLALKLLHMDVLEGNPETRDPEEDRHESQIRDPHSASKRSPSVSPRALPPVSDAAVNGGGPKRFHQPTSISTVPPSIQDAGFGGIFDTSGMATQLWQERMERGQERVENLVRSLCDSVNTMRMEMGVLNHDLADLKRSMGESANKRPGDFELYASHLAFSSAGHLSPAEVSTSPLNGKVFASVVFPSSDPPASARATSYRKSMLSTGAELGDDRPY